MTETRGADQAKRRLGGASKGLATAFEKVLSKRASEGSGQPHALAGEREVLERERQLQTRKRKAKRERQRRQALKEVAHRPPDGSEAEHELERHLRTTATRGVVKLFNALQHAQAPQTAPSEHSSQQQQHLHQALDTSSNSRNAGDGGEQSGALADRVRKAAHSRRGHALNDEAFLSRGGEDMSGWDDYVDNEEPADDDDAFNDASDSDDEVDEEAFGGDEDE